jgi:pimeloyl-ACP methyl ester carboxylesterase
MPSRRSVAQGTAAVTFGALAGRSSHAKDTLNARRHTFVLVHGAWHGGWCWRDVKYILEDAGHRVFAPTLTGLGEKSHLRSPDINLDTHIQDITNLLIWEELTDVILVGHSYGGVIISGVCDALKNRVSHAVYLDAIVPQDGDTVLPGGTKEIAEARFGPLIDGYLAPPSQPATFGVPDSMPEALAWVQRRVTPHLLGTWIQPINLPNGGSDGIPRTFVFCADKPPLSPAQLARLRNFQSDPTWDYAELPCGHDAMVILPDETANLFDRVAG